jgi:hypothetical protein
LDVGECRHCYRHHLLHPHPHPHPHRLHHRHHRNNCYRYLYRRSCIFVPDLDQSTQMSTIAEKQDDKVARVCGLDARVCGLDARVCGSGEQPLE